MSFSCDCSQTSNTNANCFWMIFTVTISTFIYRLHTFWSVAHSFMTLYTVTIRLSSTEYTTMFARIHFYQRKHHIWMVKFCQPSSKNYDRKNPKISLHKLCHTTLKTPSNPPGTRSRTNLLITSRTFWGQLVSCVSRETPQLTDRIITNFSFLNFVENNLEF